MGIKTIDMQRVETRAGTAICWAPSRIASLTSFPSPRIRLTFSITTVASSTRMPTASARPPRVITLIVSCNKLSTIIEVRMERGIETAMMNALRQLPRNSRIINAVRQAAIMASRITDPTAARTNRDWSARGSNL